MSAVPQQGQAAGRTLTELGEEECWRLLASTEVGRLAWNRAGWPSVVPVNFRVVERTIVVRISPYSVQAREIEDAQVAFEVDEIRADARTGWSVLVQGRAAFDYHRRSEGSPDPWPQGQRPLQVIITPTTVTGRRVG